MRVLFDFSRSLRRASRSTLTGIDRVDHAYARFLPAFCDEVGYVAGGGQPRHLPSLRVHDVLTLADIRPQRDPVHAELMDLLAKPAWSSHTGCRRLANRDAAELSWLSRGLAALGSPGRTQALAGNLAGVIYVNTSHSGLENSSRIRAIKARGARVVVMLHDLIPVDYPEFCRSGENLKHQARLVSVSEHADLIIANSQYSQDRFLAWAGARSVRIPRIVVVPLGLDDAFLAPAGVLVPSPAMPYFVCLGTIEARKNHAFLLLLWRRMAEELGPACPRLVLVGRRGWKIELALDLLAASQALSGSVVEVTDLGDAGVASLLSGAHGLLQPSLVEGFSLPLIEARALGVPVIASDIHAHREIAGDGVALLDPLDAPSWQAAILALVAARRNGPAHKAGLTWREHVGQAVEAIRRNLDAVEKSVPMP